MLKKSNRPWYYCYLFILATCFSSFLGFVSFTHTLRGANHMADNLAKAKLGVRRNCESVAWVWCFLKLSCCLVLKFFHGSFSLYILFRYEKSQCLCSLVSGFQFLVGWFCWTFLLRRSVELEVLVLYASSNSFNQIKKNIISSAMFWMSQRFFLEVWTLHMYENGFCEEKISDYLVLIGWWFWDDGVERSFGSSTNILASNRAIQMNKFQS
jgi:hypothetical protein